MNIYKIAERIAKVAWDTGRVGARDVNTIQLAVIDELSAAQIEEGANLHPPTSQGQNGTAGKPQVGECTTSAIG
jgi:hypothetical protein